MPDPSPSTPTVLNSNLLQLGKRSGGRPQRSVYPRRLPVNTVIHTTLAGIKRTNFQLLVWRATSSATDTLTLNIKIYIKRYVSSKWYLKTAAAIHSNIEWMFIFEINLCCSSWKHFDLPHTSNETASCYIVSTTTQTDDVKFHTNKTYFHNDTHTHT